METEKQINFLESPNINGNNLNYANPVEIYANLFEINLTKPLIVYQYPYEVSKKIEEGNFYIRRNLFRACNRELKQKYGVFSVSGDSIYSLKKVNEIKIVSTTLKIKKEKIDYKIQINKYKKEIILKQEDKVDKEKKQLFKQFIELIVKDILLTNPNLERFKDTYIMVNKGEKMKSNSSSFTFYPGFRISFVETKRGSFLNVVLNHKFIRDETILDYIIKFGNLNDKKVQEDIRNEIINRSFRVRYSKNNYKKKNYRISDILFDRNPENQHFKIEETGETVNLMKYYKQAYNKEIKNKNQPLILVKKKGPQGKDKNLYFVPELCTIVGLDEVDTSDFSFMKRISESTKMEPDVKVLETNKFVDLFVDDTENLTTEEKWTSKKKSDYYGIKVEKVKDLFKAYYMEETKLVDGNDKPYKKKSSKVNLLKNKNDKMIDWLFFYDEYNYDNAGKLNKSLNYASGKYGIKINDPEWVEMPGKAKAKDWIDKANQYFGKGKRKYTFALFLLGKNSNSNMYSQLKIHSLCTNGYISQVVRAETLGKKGLPSVCSKILLQINAKLGGAIYKIQLDKPLIGKKIMLVGVDSSKHKDKNNYGTGVAMVATINDTFTEFYNKVQIIKRERPKRKQEQQKEKYIEDDNETSEETEDNSKISFEEEYREKFHFCINKFIEEAIEVFKKNNNGKKPDSIIIYRQGVSRQQKEFLKGEIREIDNTCTTKNIPYYYILVNTKSTYKFFHPENGQYYNPYSGLLVLDEITNSNFFEFYIQPQEVTQGSATPTCFHVAYGNLNFPEIIPKLTFDLCNLYSNWEGSVRMPHVIKNAEKLSKMTSKLLLNDLNENVQIGQAYL